MNQFGHFVRQHVLGTRRFTAVLIFLFQRIDLCNVHEGEELQEAVNIGIRGVDPELIEFVRAGFLRIEPYRAAFGFTEFSPVGFGDQRNGQTKHLVLMQATGQIDTGSNVTPLVRTANLQADAVQFVQTGEVVALQQVIREFSKGDTLIVTVQALFYRFFVNHLVNREVFADVTQEGQHVHAAKPVVVIGGNRGVITTVEVEERCNLFADLIHPLLHGVFGVQFTLSGFKAWVADQTGRAAHQGHRLMACHLEAFQA